MDIEDLNKTQLILVTLLVSFVTSLTTGIIVMSYRDITPPAVTQTVNRVVERTVERVVPAETESENSAPQIIEKETTVVVKENDLITESIELNRHRIVHVGRVIESDIDVGLGATTTEPIVDSRFEVIAIGLILNSEGLVSVPPPLGDLIGLFGRTHDGTVYELSPLDETLSSDGSLRQIIQGETDAIRQFESVQFVTDKSLKLGQTAIALHGESRTSVAMGIISDLPTDDLQLTAVGTTILEEVNLGAPIINIFGEVIGIKSDDSLETGTFSPTSMVKNQLALLREVAAAPGSVETTLE